MTECPRCHLPLGVAHTCAMLLATGEMIDAKTEYVSGPPTKLLTTLPGPLGGMIYVFTGPQPTLPPVTNAEKQAPTP